MEKQKMIDFLEKFNLIEEDLRLNRDNDSQTVFSISSNDVSFKRGFTDNSKGDFEIYSNKALT